MRKFRSTEISGTVNVESNGQHMKSNMFCINCNAIGSSETHYKDCKKHEAYAIPATAEVPKKNASKRRWEIFKKQFVYAKLWDGGIMLTEVGGIKTMIIIINYDK